MGVKGTAFGAAVRAAVTGWAGDEFKKKLSDPEFAGKTVAVDSHGLLHRAAAQLEIAYALVLPDTPDYDRGCKQVVLWCEQMKHHGLGILPIFDGAAPLGKVGTKQDRAVKASAALANVRANQQYRKPAEEQDVITTALGFVNAQFRLEVVAMLKEKGFDARVSLDEADPQLAYAVQTGEAWAVMTVRGTPRPPSSLATRHRLAQKCIPVARA